MLVELHLIQNFAPSNLNRDDTGSPKDCEFGGYRRARISSQCLKRAIRTAFKDIRTARDEELLSEAHLARRTKRVLDALAERLAARGKDEGEARAVAEALFKGLGLTVDADGKTQYLLFLGEAEIAAAADLCVEHWDELQPLVAAPVAPTERQGATRARGGARDAKKAGKAAVPKAIADALRARLDGGRAADLALFGRMLADLPERNIDAASQVAHALSTNKVSTEFDFYTAVDDLRPEDTAGADMLGTVEFNSACFYRYANVDLGQLAENLGDDSELVNRTLEAFIRAAVSAIPTGKQNSMAAQNQPSFVMAVVRERGLWSLANAFVKPVRPAGDSDLVQRSIGELDGYWGKLAAMYGERDIHGKWIATLEDGAVARLADARVSGVDDLVARVMAAVTDGRAAGAA